MKWERRWELKLSDGRTVTWPGRTGEDAARRYVDCHRGTVVVASRRPDSSGVSVLGAAGQITG